MQTFIAILVSVFVSEMTVAQTTQIQTDTLYQGFVNPSNAARPRVWWHWMNGNITKDGIRKDLLWMHRSGIGGFQNFDAALMTPQIVERRLTYMTPEWKDAFRLSAKLADSLKLEMAIAGSPGWSESGGPWVKPEDGMKKLVWSEVRVKGGAKNISVPKPQGNRGPFQNIPKQPGFGESAPKDLIEFYKDVVVIAYKLPANDNSLTELNATVTSSAGNFSLAQLTDGDLNVTNLLPSDSVKGFAWILFSFPQPQTIKAVTMMGGGNKGPFGLFGDFADTRSLEISDDGKNFKRVCYIPAGSVLQQTIAIPPATAKHFRVTVKNPPPPFNFGAFAPGIKSEPPKGTDIAELVLHTASRINVFEEKAAFAPSNNLFKKSTPATTDVINSSEVIDITNKLNQDGTLNWTVPAGNWKIIRYGYSLTGINNHPASLEATGPEVDKLDPVAVKRYFTTYLDQYLDATGGLMGNKGGLRFMVTDSWEAGAQNWTGNMLQEFQKRRGYSMIPWMPVLAGNIVKSSEASEQFLFDFRKTLGDMLTEYHYDALTSILAERGMKRYTESHESGSAFIGDGMEVKRKAAVPMSAMWTPSMMNGGILTGYEADIRESASVAHIYGQNLAAAESLTAMGMGGSAWSYSPDNLKPTADLELANGLNRFVIHTSVHQPDDKKIPGLGLGPFGQWFNRHETWAENAKSWTDYLSRSSYLLQQGKFVADIAYYYGEDSNITALFGKKLPEIPEGYNYDFINADALVNLLSVKDGKLITPSGMSYHVLVLDSNAQKMSLPVLRKISQLVKAGATISGVKPDATPSLSDNQQEFKTLVNEIWSAGNKNVTTGRALRDVLASKNIVPDFTYSKSSNDTKLMYVHRTAQDREIYWVNNRNAKSENVEVTFRVSGKVPQIWHPENAVIESASYTIANGVTKVKMHLTPNDAVFVIFKDNAAQTTVELPAAVEKELTTINSEWTINFQEGRGAPATIKMNGLSSLSNHADAGVKYFSGKASYVKTIDAASNWFSKQSQVWLDLGDVKDLAEVIVNGKSLGVVWKKPFRVNITDALKQGTNSITIKVTNLWVNRLIGDEQPGVKKITYTTMPFFSANSPLLPSGLLGPVKIFSITKDSIK